MFGRDDKIDDSLAVDLRTFQEPKHSPVSCNKENYSPQEPWPLRRSPRDVSKIVSRTKLLIYLCRTIIFLKQKIFINLQTRTNFFDRNEKNDEHSDDSFTEPEELQDDSSDEYKPHENQSDSESSEEESIPTEAVTPPIVDSTLIGR